MHSATTAAPCSSHQLHRALVAGAGPVAVLEVDRVDDRTAAEALQPGAQHLGLGGVEHHRQRGGGREPAGQLGHVGHAVAAHVVDAQVDQVRALAGLLARDADAGLPVLGQHGLAELLRAVGVGPLADHEHRRVLPERHRGVERADTPGSGRGCRSGRRRSRIAATSVADVLRCGAAAAADQRDPVLVDERGERRGQLVGGERVHGAVRAELGQPGVRHHRERDPRVLGQRAQVLAHLGGPGGAVQPDEVDAERLQRGERGADLGAEQHRAGGLDGDLRHDRHPPALGGHRPAHAQDGRLGLQEVLAGLDDDRVGAARDAGRGRTRRRRRGGGRTSRGPASAAWCRGRPSRARTAAGPAWTSRRPPRGPARCPSRRARGSARGCRTRRGWAGSPRTCSSRRRPRPPRSRRGGWRGPRRAGCR